MSEIISETSGLDTQNKKQSETVSGPSLTTARSASLRTSLLIDDDNPIHSSLSPDSSHSSLIIPLSAPSVPDLAPGLKPKPTPGNGLGETNNATPPVEAPEQRLTRLEQLNWCSRTELLENTHLLSVDQNYLLRSVEKKRTQFPDGFDKGNYFDNILPIIASGYHLAQKISFCCGPLSGPCNQWGYCSRCAFIKGINTGEMYRPSFTRSTFFHITCSFDGDLPFSATNSIDVQLYWNAIKTSITQLISLGSIDGAYIGHELKIRSFLPLRVLPHSHILISASTFGAELQNQLSQLIAAKPGITLAPSIHAIALSDRFDIQRTIAYQTKAIDLREAYTSAWNTKVDPETRANAIDLNLQMKEFVDAFSAARYGFHCIVRMGNLNTNCKTYLGLSAKAVKHANRKRPKHKLKKPRS